MSETICSVAMSSSGIGFEFGRANPGYLTSAALRGAIGTTEASFAFTTAA